MQRWLPFYQVRKGRPQKDTLTTPPELFSGPIRRKEMVFPWHLGPVRITRLPDNRLSLAEGERPPPTCNASPPQGPLDPECLAPAIFLQHPLRCLSGRRQEQHLRRLPAPPAALPLANNADVLLQQVIADVIIGLEVAHGHLGPLAQDRGHMVLPHTQGFLQEERQQQLSMEDVGWSAPEGS